MKFRQIKRIAENSRTFVCLLLLLLFSIWYHLHRKTLLKFEDFQMKSRGVVHVKRSRLHVQATEPMQQQINLKYILLWTSHHSVPFVYLEEGQNRFIKNLCQYTNCYVTSDRSFLGDYTKFDVIVFSGPEVVQAEAGLPNRRSIHQKYAFASIESSYNYALCSDKFNGYFNWTWTYKLDSDSRWGYIVVRDMDNNVIGPNKVMHWMKVEDMKPLSKEFQNSLLSKSKAAAWFVSDCETSNKREDFANSLQVELELFGLSIDKYGQCGMLLCPREDQERCNEMIVTTYYFYLAFENAFGEDYVTEKVMHALKNNVIPIVYGGANYTRFMPDGIYLNARELGPKKLANKMNELINSPTTYAKYFKWKNHYKFQTKSESEETDDFCNICKLLNNKKMMTKKTVYENFRQWWDIPNIC